MDFLDLLEDGGIGSIMTILKIFGYIIGFFIVFLLLINYFNALNIFRITRMLKTWKPNLNFIVPNFRGLRGKTKEQKKFVRYFRKKESLNSIILFLLVCGCVYFTISIIESIRFLVVQNNNSFFNYYNILSPIISILILIALIYFVYFYYIKLFRKMSNSTFEELLNNKVDDIVSKIEERALDVHGMDADEVKEIPPILAEDYYPGSRYFKILKDNTFRASEYQMSYLMFSEKQVYAYSYIFDLTSTEITEQTKEYFYDDITTMDISKKQTEFPTFQFVKKFFWGGIACLFVGLMILFFQIFSVDRSYKAKQDKISQEMNTHYQGHQLYEQYQNEYEQNEQIYQESQELYRTIMAEYQNNYQVYQDYLKMLKQIEQDYEKEQTQVGQNMEQYEQSYQIYEEDEKIYKRNEQAHKKQRGSALIFIALFMVVGVTALGVSIFKGFSSRLVESLILRLTVANDEFVCAMKPENIEAIQGMKAKIRDKKR